MLCHDGGMDTSSAFRMLIKHQERILALIARATEAVKGEPALSRDDLAKARWEMTRLLRSYQIFKHTEIFDPFIAHDPGEKARVAEQLKMRCIEAGNAFRDYVLEWSSRDVVTCWASYKPAMLAMTKQLRTHLAQERRDVEALLSGEDHVRRFAA